MYLGYEWEKQVSILTSRLTLLVQEELGLSFLSSTTVNAVGEYDNEPKEYHIQGFVIPYKYVGKISREKVEEMIADLKCIHINKTFQHELALAVCAYPSIMQAYYNMMWEGSVSTNVFRELQIELGKDIRKTTEEEFKELEDKYKALIPCYSV